MIVTVGVMVSAAAPRTSRPHPRRCRGRVDRRSRDRRGAAAPTVAATFRPVAGGGVDAAECTSISTLTGRRRRGVALQRRLTIAAQRHANDMAARNRLTHTGSDGSNAGADHPCRVPVARRTSPSATPARRRWCGPGSTRPATGPHAQPGSVDGRRHAYGHGRTWWWWCSPAAERCPPRRPPAQLANSSARAVATLSICLY